MNSSIEPDAVAEPVAPESPQSHGFGYTARLVLERANSSEIMSRAAQLAYYLLFALFPTLIFIAVLVSIQPLPNLFENLMDYFQRVLPPQTFSIVKTTLENAAGSRPKGLLSLSLIIVIWAASSGMEALISALNAAYEVPASRGLLKERLLAIMLTFALGILTSLTLITSFFGETIGNQISMAYGFGGTFERIWGMLRWPIAFWSSSCFLICFTTSLQTSSKGGNGLHQAR